MILLNNRFEAETDIDERIFADGLSIYEVIRIFDGHPIFLKDNLLRLSNSLHKSDIGIQVESLDIPDKLGRLIMAEHITGGNVKYVLHFTGNRTDEYMFQIPHHYPSETDYEQGVPVMTYRMTRENPEVKYFNQDLRAISNRLMETNHVYEVLLVDKDGCITEGSRSNLFFVRGETLYTCPSAYVLPGTSRKRVFGICREHGIPIHEQRIFLKDIRQYDAAFLTGTSPLILPLNCIDKTVYSTRHPLMRRLMEYYFALLE